MLIMVNGYHQLDLSNQLPQPADQLSGARAGRRVTSPRRGKDGKTETEEAKTEEEPKAEESCGARAERGPGDQHRPTVAGGTWGEW